MESTPTVCAEGTSAVATNKPSGGAATLAAEAAVALAARQQRAKDSAAAKPAPAKFTVPVPPITGPGNSLPRATSAILRPLCGLKVDELLLRKRETAKDEAPKDETSTMLPKDLPRLLHVKGRRRPFARHVELTWKSLNTGDCFVLDVGKNAQLIYQWNGKESNRIEKGKAMDIAKNIKDKERFGARVVIVAEGDEPPEFWKVMGGAPTGPIASAAEGGDDVETEQAIGRYITLYRVTHDTNFDNVDLEKVSEDGRSLYKGMINPTACHILDCTTEIFAWTCLRAPAKLRKQILALADKLYEERSSTFWVCPVHHEFAGSEQVMFKERFNDWNTVPISVQAVSVGQSVSVARPLEAKVDVVKLFAKKQEKEQVMIDNGTGKLKIWRIEEFTKVEIDAPKYGQFYSAESYVILYTYIWKNKDCFLIYFWQGRNSTIVGKGTSAYMAVDLDDRLKNSGMTKEVRVVQGKEPKHFMTVFQGKLVVHQGRDPQARDPTQQHRERERLTIKQGRTEMALSSKGAALYHVSGSEAVYTKAVQTTPVAASLSSCSVYIITLPEKCFLWCGKHSNEHERGFAKQIVTKPACTLHREAVSVVEEGSEPDEFWAAIDGKFEYPTKNLASRVDPRLFQCSVGSGTFTVEEITQFSQDDLIHDDVMMLDAREIIFVWVGKASHHSEQKQAYELAMQYATLSPTIAGRPQKVPQVWRVMHGSEPYVFTVFFHGWDPLKLQSYDGDLVSVESLLGEFDKTYSYADLVARRFPKGLNESKLEAYMSDAEFGTVMDMDKAAWEKLPVWKKEKLKREKKLF
eukprot:TRINITY_DN194_c2_g2_i1.p1 TRINITY_DN194_c2_g2~~TRINITY_DN194_c2_g2_i1.p1  ORF type:complete len:804 (-),score=184.15 TRINITY_DN194_c2_g2_i1:27-2438(-)